ncbi:MAG: alpha/beta fold hydrolase [Phycicoccus sp.]
MGALAATGALVLGVGVSTLAAAPASATPVAAPAAPAKGWGGLAGASAPEVPAIDWQPCPDAEGVQCATVELPTDYDDPKAGTTTIALARIRATDPENRIGSVLFNPGGPGGSGVSTIKNNGAAFPDDLKSRFDLVGFDPRGTNASDPATCFPTAEAETEFFGTKVDPPFEGEPASEGAYLGRLGELAARCQVTAPDRFRHMSTANVARDMDVLRAAVGDEKLNFYGLSYGTIVGQTYARLFPENVRTLILDGNVDPTEYVGKNDRRPVGVRTGQDLSLDETFTEFLRLCAEGGQNCPINAVGEPKQVVDSLLARLLEGPITVEDESGQLDLTYDIIVATIVDVLYDPPKYADLAALLAALATTDTTAVDRGVAALGLQTRLRGEDYTSQGGNIGVLCSDTRPVGNPLAYPRFADQQDRKHGFLGRASVWKGLNNSAVCEFWADANRDQDAYLGNWKQTTDAEVLVLNPRYDPATAWQNAAPAAAKFRNAQVLTVQGWGHTTLSAGSSCSVAVWTQYLIDGAIPTDAPDTCPADVVPFQDAPATGEKQPDADDQDRAREREQQRELAPTPPPIG